MAKPISMTAPAVAIAIFDLATMTQKNPAAQATISIHLGTTRTLTVQPWSVRQRVFGPGWTSLQRTSS
jgi:hypothetical protein